MLDDSKMMKQAMSFTFEPINYMEIIYIDRLFTTYSGS